MGSRCSSKAVNGPRGRFTDAVDGSRTWRYRKADAKPDRLLAKVQARSAGCARAHLA
jgi:hypothetical protein